MAVSSVPKPTTLTRHREVLTILGFAILFWIVVYSVFAFNRLDWVAESDTGDYWSASERLGEFPTIEMPGYPILIAIVRSLLPLQFVVLGLQIIGLISYVASVGIMYYTLKAMRLRLAYVGAFLFGLYPLVALTNAVAPRVNGILLLTITVAIFAYTTKRNRLLLVVLSIAMLLHKSAWPYVVLLLLLGLFERRLRLVEAASVFIPFGIYWLLGANHHGDALWLVQRSYAVQFAPRSSWLLLEGLLSSFSDGFRGSLPDLIKGGLLLGQLTIALFLIGSGIWKTHRFLLALLIPPILFGLTLNQMQILATVNYSTYLAVPITVFLSEKRFSLTRQAWAWVLILSFCFASQLLYAIYVVSFLRS